MIKSTVTLINDSIQRPVALMRLPQGKAIIRDRAPIYFLRNNREQNFNTVFIKKGTITETVSNSTKYTVNV